MIIMMLTAVLKRRYVWRFGGLAVVDALFFGNLDPQRVPSVVLIVGFGLLSLTLYYLLAGLLALPGLYGLSPGANRLADAVGHSSSRSGSRRLRLAAALTGLAAGMVALQSIGQLAPRDVLVLTLLALLSWLYLSYARLGKRQNG